MLQDTERKVYRIILNSSKKGSLVDIDQLVLLSGHNKENIKLVLRELIKTGKVQSLNENRFVSLPYPDWLKRMTDDPNPIYAPSDEERYYGWLLGRLY